MKLPKNFGGQGFGGMLKQAQDAMARAQQLEEELAQERIAIDKGPVKAIFDGTGMLLGLKIDQSVVDPEDIEALEDLIVSAVRDGFTTATDARQAKVQSIMPNIPGLG
ncbi:MAG: nucleoid-associated protein, YbaB/EbfC family [Armatimonadetes bacterium 55-13]|nr:YbaB/EbfC family nucleoid-associated protein [Armatimonadota bacterium]OJU61503.1 MAG: nucleoid-associated protein, YbaB/EbfC family [Armatimonadetes bacterium 55-13]